MESEPFATLNVGEEKYEVTRENATLYRHLGNTALDHLFVSLGENSGIYVWQNNPAYDAVAAAAVANECMLILNIQEPSEMDVRAFMKHNTKDVGELPSWLPEV